MGSCTFVSAQNKVANASSNIFAEPRTVIIPPSPQSQIFEQYINHQVTEYNGLPEINVPLYTIKIKGLEIPIMLSYHASGIKYKQFDGEIGAGWSINAGGYRVSRTIYGRPDDEYDFYDGELFHDRLLHRTSSYSTDSLVASVSLGPTEVQDVEPHVRGHLKDSEYDQFVYMSPSANGHFIINNRKTYEVDVLSDNPDRVKLLHDTRLRHIDITDGNGFSYLFGYSDISGLTNEVVYDSKLGYNVTTGWMLSSIQSPYNENVLFRYGQYQTYTVRNLAKSYTLTDASEHCSLNYPLLMNPNLTTSSGLKWDNQADYFKPSDLLLVNSIETDQVVVSFIRGRKYSCFTHDQYSPIVCGDHVLTKITVKDKNSGKYLKIISFDYGLSPLNADTSKDLKPWHRLLSSISIKDGTDKPIQKYNFGYNSAPASSGSFPDLWGYYKEDQYRENEDGAYRDLFFDTIFNNDLIVSSINHGMASKMKLGNMYSGIRKYNRSVIDKVPDYFSLKSIQYPTGGITRYFYESNEYRNGIKGGGLRIKKIISEGEKPVTTEFFYGSGVLSGGFSDFKRCFAEEYHYFSTYINTFGQPEPYLLGTSQSIKVYGSNPLDMNVGLFMKIYYDKVITKQYDQTTQAYIGQTESQNFRQLPEYELGYENSMPNFKANGTFHVDNYIGYGREHVQTYRLGLEPRLLSRTVYNQDSVRMKDEQWEYSILTRSSREGLHAKQKIFFENYPGQSNSPGNYEHYKIIPYIFDSGFYNIEYCKEKPVSYTLKQYDQDGQNPVVVSTSYEYDSRGRLKGEITDYGNNCQKEEWFTYPAANSYLYDRNMLQTIVEKVNKENQIETERWRYHFPDHVVYPDSLFHSKGAEMRLEFTFDKYDSYGNLLQYTRLDGVKISYIWSYEHKYPIAEIINASWEEISACLPSLTLENIAYKREPSEDDWESLINLKERFKSAQITIYKYKPLVGLTEKIEPSGFTTCFHYDNFGRLIQTSFKEDQTERVMQSYEYGYTIK